MKNKNSFGIGIIFSIFLIIFLAFWCYMAFINKNYILLVLSIPFWIILVASIKNTFFKTKNIEKNLR